MFKVKGEEELEGIRQKTVVIYSKVLTRHLCAALETAGASVEIRVFSE
jgi:hypothetical protein